jgi:hypothetical protein
MGKKKSKGKKKASPMQPEGRAGVKRTPTGHYDPDKGKDMYKPVKIVAERTAKSTCPCSACGGSTKKTETQWQVKWEGCSSSSNTWEPMVHLAGNEEMTIVNYSYQIFFLAAPISSAGVERVFSAAGRMHGPEQKRQKGETLKHILFAAFNSDL